MNTAREAVITAVVRTPFGRFNGALARINGPRLGAAVIDALLERSNVPPGAVQAAYLGVGMIGAATLTPVRQAVLLSGLPRTTPSLAVDRACCSGMTAVGLGYKDVLAGTTDVVLCGGFESLSNTPLLLPRTRSKPLGDLTVEDPLLLRGPVVDMPIAAYTSKEALQCGVDRLAQDGWALESHQRYFRADGDGFFDFERMPARDPSDIAGAPLLVSDEGPRRDTSAERLAGLRPVHGSQTITAGNAPGLSDGAAAMLMMSRTRARDLGVQTLARIVDYVQVSDGPTSGSYTPAIAIESLMTRNNMTAERLDLIEINEAFAATPLVSTLKLAGGDPQKARSLRARTNVHGGAVAIGHPLGASGARLVMTLINGLRRRGGGWGVAAICGGFGQGDAVLLEVRG